MRNNRERLIKKVLINQILETRRIGIKEIIRWLWEDFGIKCRNDWKDIERKIVKSKEISSNDLAVFMINNGIKPREDVWFEGDM